MDTLNMYIKYKNKTIDSKIGRYNHIKQVVPRVGRPTVMLTISKQTVMKKECYYEV